MGIVRLIWALLKAFFASPVALAAENLALRQQLLVLQRSVKGAFGRHAGQVAKSLRVKATAVSASASPAGGANCGRLQ